MKRVIALIAVIAALLIMNPFAAQAAETDRMVIHYEDGSYLVIENEVSNTRITTKVGSKTAEYYSANDEIQWKMTITGEFLYDGNTCTCTYASGTTTIYATSLWGKNSDSASYSGNSGTYTVVFNRKFMGITTNTVTQVLTITCDENGNIS